MITGEIFFIDNLTTSAARHTAASVFLFPSAPDGVGTTKTGSPGALRTPRRVAMATVLRVDNGCSFLLLLPLSCLCFLVLFSRKEVAPPTHTVAPPLGCSSVFGRTRTRLTIYHNFPASRKLRRPSSNHMARWPSPPLCHCFEFKRVHTIAPLRIWQVSRLQSAAPAAPRPPRRRLHRIRWCSRVDLSRFNHDEEAKEWWDESHEMSHVAQTRMAIHIVCRCQRPFQ